MDKNLDNDDSIETGSFGRPDKSYSIIPNGLRYAYFRDLRETVWNVMKVEGHPFVQCKSSLHCIVVHENVTSFLSHKAVKRKAGKNQLVVRSVEPLWTSILCTGCYLQIVRSPSPLSELPFPIMRVKADFSSGLEFFLLDTPSRHAMFSRCSDILAGHTATTSCWRGHFLLFCPFVHFNPPVHLARS